MSNPFGCGPNPCGWKCRPVVIPIGCAFCVDGEGPQAMVVRMPGWSENAVGCGSCADFGVDDFLLPFIGDFGLYCEWQIANQVFQCSVTGAVQYAITLQLSASVLAVQLASTTYPTWTCRWAINVTTPIDCFDTYVLPLTTNTGGPAFCDPPASITINP